MNQDFNPQPDNRFSNQSINPNIPQATDSPSDISQRQPQPAINPYTIDYLNQIAPKPIEPFWTKNKIILAAGLVLALCLSLFLFLNQGNRADSMRESLLRAYYNIEKTRDLAKKYQPKLRSSNLSSVNSGLTAALSSEETKFKSHLEAKKIKLFTDSDKKKNEKYLQIDKDYAELDQKLDDAFLNAMLDEVYAREVAFHLDQLRGLLFKVKARANSKATDEIIDAVNDNLETSIRQIENYDDK